MLVLPTFDETPNALRDDTGAIVYPGFAADDLYEFRLHSLGTALVAGRNRVPSPAAGMTPFRIFASIIPLFLTFKYDLSGILEIVTGKGISNPLNRYGIDVGEKTLDNLSVP